MDEEKREINVLGIAFIVIQVIFVVFIVSIIAMVTKPDDVTVDVERSPRFTISNLSSLNSDIDSELTRKIEHAFLKVALANSAQDKVVDSDVVANIVDNTASTVSFNNGSVKLFSGVIDIPELNQSYDFYYGYPTVRNYNYEEFYAIFCPGRIESKIYSDFYCKTSSNPDVTQKNIVLSFLPRFRFEYFSAYIEPANPNKIIISPSVTYDNNDNIRTKYIEEVKSAISSIGCSPDDYDYYVRTSSDVNYYNHS